MFNVTITYDSGYELHYYNLKQKFVNALISNLSDMGVRVDVVQVVTP